MNLDIDPRLENLRRPLPSCIETVKLYDNKYQANLAHNVIIYLNQCTGRVKNPNNEHEAPATDVARGALIAAVKFNVQTRYEENRMNFTKEDVKEIMKQVEDILNVQVDSMYKEQVFAH